MVDIEDGIHQQMLLGSRWQDLRRGPKSLRIFLSSIQISTSVRITQALDL